MVAAIGSRISAELNVFCISISCRGLLQNHRSGELATPMHSWVILI